MLQRTQNFRCRFVSLNLLVLVDGFDLCSRYVVFVVKNVDLRVTSSKRLTAYLIMYNGTVWESLKVFLQLLRWIYLSTLRVISFVKKGEERYTWSSTCIFGQKWFTFCCWLRGCKGWWVLNFQNSCFLRLTYLFQLSY